MSYPLTLFERYVNVFLYIFHSGLRLRFVVYKLSSLYFPPVKTSTFVSAASKYSLHILSNVLSYR